MAYSETRFSRGGDVSSGTGWFVVIVTALALLCIGYLVFSAERPAPVALTSAHVLVDLPNGHGSATHIGDGLYVTAAHVVGDNAEVTINGVDSAVLWANTEYDIALVAEPDTAASVPLACVTPRVGEVGKAHGNPMAFEDITTTSTVAGKARQVGDWKVAVPVDGTMGPGMSGGGWVIGGALVGVNVGVALAPAGFGVSYFGLSIIVPGSVVCELMGRK